MMFKSALVVLCGWALGITAQQAPGQYQPRTLTAEYCEHLSDAECETRDRNFAEQAKKRRLIVESQGALNVLVIPLKWTDTPASRTLPSVEALDELWNGVGVSDNIPSGSIANYTKVNSHGKLTISATVVDWIEADNSELYYAAGRSGRPNGNTPGTVQFEDVIFYALEQLEATGFDFMPFDLDNDVVIDAVAILHSGYAAELGEVDCSNGRAKLDRIQSHYAVAGEPRFFGGYGHMVGSYVVASAFNGACDSDMARIGIIQHETIHLFGIPDLYDTAGPYSDSGCCVGGLGGFDIMALPFGQKYRLDWPGHLSPWTKYQLGWITPMEINSDGKYTLRPSELYPDVYMIRSPYPEGEYLLLEVRRPLLFDSNLWEPGGLLIYHIDENAEGPGNQVRGFPGQNGWPGNGNHYRVALMQQDGQYNLEKANDNGDIADFWVGGQNLVFGPGNGESVADSATYPNTDAYAHGAIEVTGLTITNFEDQTDGSVSFEVFGMPNTGELNPPAPTGPTPTDPPTTVPTKAPVAAPTKPPTAAPTKAPVPVPAPTNRPTAFPTKTPVAAPTKPPTTAPTEAPVPQPTKSPPSSSSTQAPAPTNPPSTTAPAPTNRPATPSLAPAGASPTVEQGGSLPPALLDEIETPDKPNNPNNNPGDPETPVTADNPSDVSSSSPVRRVALVVIAALAFCPLSFDLMY